MHFQYTSRRDISIPYDYTFQSITQYIDNLSSMHKFAHVYVNGKNWGVMDIASKELLEKQNRKDFIIVRFGNENLFFV